MLICCVVVGSLFPAASPVVAAVGRLHINGKVQHFCAYLALSSLPVIGFRDGRSGIVVGLSMFVLGVLLEAGQHFSPGRAVELGDVIANGAGNFAFGPEIYRTEAKPDYDVAGEWQVVKTSMIYDILGQKYCQHNNGFGAESHGTCDDDTLSAGRAWAAV